MHPAPLDHHLLGLGDGHNSRLCKANLLQAEELIVGRYHDEPCEWYHGQGGHTCDQPTSPWLFGTSLLDGCVAIEKEGTDSHGR